MKKILMGLTALLATSFALPTFAEEAPAGEKAEKPAKKKGSKKKEKKGEEKPAEGAPAK